MRRRRAAAVGMVAAVLSLSLAIDASATIYWGDSDSVERVNLDGSYRSDVREISRFYVGSWIPSTGETCAVAVDETHIYWASRYANAIGRANLDGSNPNYAYIAGADEPCGVAVDGSHVYWTNLGSTTIGRANLDGTGVDQGFIDAGGVQPCGVAVDGSYVYWDDEGKASLGRADLNGENVEQEFIPDSECGCGVALDGSHIYWASLSETIGRANLDGSGVNPGFIDGLNRPCGVAVAAGRLYWTEEAFGSGRIGWAKLDGSEVERGFLTGLGFPCGIAVDPLSFVPPSLPPSNIVLGKVRHNRRTGVAFLAVDTAAPGHFKVETGLGVAWVFSGEGHGPALSGGHRWLRLKPAADTYEGLNLRRKLKNRGRVRIKVRIRFSEAMKAETTVSRSLTLVRKRPKRR